MSAVYFLLLYFCPIIFVSSEQYNGFPVLTISNGEIRGTNNKTIGRNTTYYAFRGIPYAEPPVGELRFKAPLEAKKWNGTLDATRDRSGCVQGVGSIIGTEKTVFGSEDCLFINVYTPSLTDRDLPVMAFIHGGTFEHQNSSYALYGPDYFLEKSVVYVAFNYRLGIFGYLSTEDMACPGNWGLKDQLLALQWIQKNIEYFGGSPKKVTIFGQSAGSVSVSYLVQIKKARGLFRSAIMQSGVSLCEWALDRDARYVAFEVAQGFGIKTNDTEELIRKLRKIDEKTLHRVSSRIAANVAHADTLIGIVSFSIVREPSHEGALFDDNSFSLLSNGDFARVPMIIGFNSNEVAYQGNIFLTLLGRIYVIIKFDFHRSLLVPADMGRNKTEKRSIGKLLQKYYFGVASASTQRNTVVKFLSNDQFARPIRQIVVQASKYVPVYFYEFSHEGVLNFGDHPDFQGVGHSEELKYLFRKDTKVKIPESDIKTRDQMVTLWTNFAKHGNPTPEKEPLLENITWPKVTPGNLAYLNFGNKTLTIEKNPNKIDMDLYDGLYCEYGKSPLRTY